MITAKAIFEFSHTLKVLYVEDDDTLRAETLAFFEPFFASIETATDGLDGLKKYNEKHYDLVITDINMPNMNGIDMSYQIHDINPDQKILVISAHNESDLLINLIRNGISSFILKPIIQEDALKALYTVSRDARTSQLNQELFDQLSAQKEELERQNKKLKAQVDAIGVKNHQVEVLLEKVSPTQEVTLKQEEPKPQNTIDDNAKAVVDDYFQADEDEGVENVCFNSDDAEEMKEIMEEGMETASLYCSNENEQLIEDLGNLFLRMNSILNLYTPFLDPLAVSMRDLGEAIINNKEQVMSVFKEYPDSVFSLFNAITIDMHNYIDRFSVESMAMKNIHHIHHPTSLSIQQVISLIAPVEIDDGGMEFF